MLKTLLLRYLKEEHAFGLVGALIGSAVIGAASSALGQSSANKANAKEASKSRDYTTEQMKNKHQWESEDLKKAGLNRILTTNSTGGMGSSAQATAGNVGADVGKNIGGAAQALAQLDLTKAQTASTNAGTAKAITETAGIAADNKLRTVKGNLVDTATQPIKETTDQVKGFYNSAKQAYRVEKTNRKAYEKLPYWITSDSGRKIPNPARK